MKTPSAQDQAELIGTRLIIWDYKSGLGIYRSGFFGKPVGIPKPKPDQDFEVPLLLDLMEGLYLLEHKRIGVIDGRTKKPVGKSVLLKAARDTYRGFSAAYQVLAWGCLLVFRRILICICRDLICNPRL